MKCKIKRTGIYYQLIKYLFNTIKVARLFTSMIQKSNHKIGEIQNKILRSQKQMHELEYHLRQMKVCVGKLTLRVFFF